LRLPADSRLVDCRGGAGALSPLSRRGFGKLADDLEKERDAEDDANAAIGAASAAVARSFFYIVRRANPRRVTAWNGSPATLILAAGCAARSTSPSRRFARRSL